MPVVLVLLTFAVFILLDWALNRRKAPQAVAARARVESGLPAPPYVEGFLVPERLSYHPGHGWALQERRNLARIGMDEFAASLAGRIDRIELPKPGHWIRQGQRVWSLYRDGEKTDMVSPVEGEVVEVNREAAAHPELLRQDPYGQGWLALVHVPDEENTSRNMIPKGMVRSWMREAVGRLYARQPRLEGYALGAAEADGGVAAADLLAGLPDADWKQVTGEFFLTA